MRRVHWLVLLSLCSGLVGASAADPPISSNSIVRFHITTGQRTVGDIDVELFNEEKPGTVRNFLLYVRNGSYRDVLLHRLAPGFVLQGGGFTNQAPITNSSTFLDFGMVRNLGQITNEFAVGPQLSNLSGTIAMAKVGTNAHSASSQWFFNLGDNSENLDVQAGGFTVFGRVLSSTNETEGTNLLNVFNSLSESNGIIDMSSFFGPVWAPFADLPVDFSGYALPQNRQLFYVTVTELNGPADPDTNAPALTIAMPEGDTVVTNANLTLAGTASDDMGVARVIYYFGDATPRVANGTTNWSASLTLSLGTNIVSVHSVDEAGNLSPAVQRTIRYLLPSQAVSNTIVRFEVFTGNGPVGNLDVELFDQDKPQTVRNFLLYVRNGSYNNVLLHRLAPGFVLQGGGYTNVHPLNDQPFTLFDQIPSLGMITNEFAVGRRMSNTVGTLAMAKLGNNPHSASSEWFFNLTNNAANLDTQNGGFTVFGRVLPKTNQMAGTNLLHMFNSLSRSNGIIDMTTFYGPTWSAFSELPVDFTNYALPRNQDLFYVTVSELNGPAEADTNAPAVTVTFPEPDAVVTNATITLTGTATDDQAVARVIYYFGSTSPRVAAGTTNWSATVALRSGTNFVFVQSVDRFGNRSPLVERRFVHRMPSLVTLEVKGSGHVSGVVNGQELNVGEVYTVEATPARGWYFSGWSGTVSSANEEFTFRMQTNMMLTATFKLLPFPEGQGRYAGLFIATNQPSPDSAGTFQTVIKRNRHHSGRIFYRGGNYVFDAAFDPTGATSLQGALLNQNVTMTLRLDVTEPPRRVAGVAFIGGTVSAVEAYRVERRARHNTLAEPGQYTFLIGGAPNAATAPGGQGFGTMKMGKSGRINLKGTLGEGTELKEKAQLTGQDRWPFFSKLYDNAGSILGWARFDTNRPGSFNGTLYWFKPTDLADAFYPTGFTASVQFRGARFDPPPDGERVFNWTNGTVIVQGGDLQSPLTFRVTLEEDDTFTTLTGPTSLTLAIDRRTGAVSGSFFHPVTQTDMPLEGIVLRGIDEGGGRFFGPVQTGSFLIQKQ